MDEREIREKLLKECNPLKSVEELLEDDYGMIDGIINNGPKKAMEESGSEHKPSILDKLHEGQRMHSESIYEPH